MSDSNDYHPNGKQQKVISIKDLSEIKQSNVIHQKDNVYNEAGKIKGEVERLQQEILSLQEKKSQLLEDIKKSIETEKAAWVETKEQERKEAHQVGYKTGYDAGQEEAQLAYEEKLIEANNIVESAKKDYFQTIAQHEKAIIQLAMVTAEKVLQQKFDENQQYVIELVKLGISDLKDRSEIAVYVAPTAYEFVMKRKDELQQLLEEGEVLSIYTDKQMKEGDCLIKHAFGQVDVGIDVQLKQIKAALEEKVAEN